MNRLEYLAALEKALKSAGVRDLADILEEYAEHFDMKTADGYGEDEISARLGPPEEIAAQFKEITPSAGRGIGTKIMLAVGLFFADLGLAVPIFAALYSWIAALGATAISTVLVGLVMATGIDRLDVVSAYVHMPYMPYVFALLLGIALLALGVLAAAGTVYCAIYITRLLKAYFRWHKTVWAGASRKSPPKPLHPVLSPKKRRRMRSVVLISLLVFAVFLVAAYGSMAIATGSFEPWHVWGWFV